MNSQQASGVVLWFTGLSGSGKSTLATLVGAELRSRALRVELLDGDEVRTHLSKGLGFSREDRDQNVRRIGFVAKLLARNGVIAITAAISPYRNVRDELRANIGGFVEIYCSCSIDALAARDPKGLYLQALAGKIANFTGVSDPYEAPLDPELTLDTERESAVACAAKIVAYLEECGHLAPRSVETLIAPHGGELPSFARLGPGVQEPVLGELPVSPRDALLLLLAAEQLLCPVVGPMNDKDLIHVSKDCRLESGLCFPLTLGAQRVGSAPSPAPGLYRLRGGSGALFRLDSVSDEGRLRGSLVRAIAQPPLASRARHWLGERKPEQAAAVFVEEVPPSHQMTLIELALEVCSHVLLFDLTRDASVTCRLQAWVAERSLEDRVLLLALPGVPELPTRDWALMALLLAKNCGAENLVLCAADADAGREIDASLSRFSAAELGVRLLARGPVARVGDRYRTGRT